jgi:SAM-dependent methyltransferase
VITCGLCSNKSDILYALRGSAVNVCKCGVCGLEFLSPVPDSDVLKREYQGYEQKRSCDVFRPKYKHFSGLLSKKKDLFAAVNTVLEIGSAEGDCVYAVNKLFPGVTVHALENNSAFLPGYADLNCKLVNQSLEEFLKEKNDIKFDLIMMFDVIEHFLEPAAVLSELVDRHLAKGGYIVASFPNADSLSRKVLGANWFQYKLEHISYFSSRSVDLLCEKCKVKKVSLEVLRKCLPLEYVLSVGRHFGHPVIRGLVKMISRLLPKALGGVYFRIAFGEFLLTARKS